MSTVYALRYSTGFEGSQWDVLFNSNHYLTSNRRTDDNVMSMVIIKSLSQRTRIALRNQSEAVTKQSTNVD